MYKAQRPSQLQLWDKTGHQHIRFLGQPLSVHVYDLTPPPNPEIHVKEQTTTLETLCPTLYD